MNKKEINFEINLLPVISLLAVCISFLLLTAVWVQIGTFNAKQALGSDGAEEQKKNPPSLWVTFEQGGELLLGLKDLEGEKAPKEIRISPRGNQVDIESLAEMTVSLKQQIPELNTALILPSAYTKYQDMIAVMDQLKKVEIRDLGVAPL
ncbi:MAG: biopolymer transporter ExbD [Bdellovibrionales bacterium]|nr:biopolymer transporter ExbD [Bdellovibrionales bacterium]